jgi:hypothetical protein
VEVYSSQSTLFKTEMLFIDAVDHNWDAFVIGIENVLKENHSAVKAFFSKD